MSESISEQIPDRYEKKPMLVIVENYILDTLGLLDAEKVLLLDKIVCRTFGGTDWRKIVREQFQLPPDTDDTLRTLWKQRQEQADAQQSDFSPKDFARDQADQLFTNLGQ